MQYKKTLASAALATTALAAYAPSEPWSTLTPSATFKSENRQQSRRPFPTFYNRRLQLAR